MGAPCWARPGELSQSAATAAPTSADLALQNRVILTPMAVSPAGKKLFRPLNTTFRAGARLPPQDRAKNSKAVHPAGARNVRSKFDAQESPTQNEPAIYGARRHESAAG